MASCWSENGTASLAKAFDDLKSTINKLELTDEAAAVEKADLQRHFQSAETFTRITISEYRRSNGPLVILTIFNTFGFSIVAFKNRKRPYKTGGDNSAALRDTP